MSPWPKPMSCHPFAAGAGALISLLLAGACGTAEPAASGTALEQASYDPTTPVYSVGLRSLMFRDESRDGRLLPTEVWFPATEESVQGRIPTRMVPDVVGAFPEGVPDRSDAPYPLIVFSHGHQGIRFQSTFLTIQLASRGYVVAAMDHTGNTILDDSASSEQSHADRPLDLSFVVDQLLDSSEEVLGDLAGLADKHRVGAAGHSRGAWTALATQASDPRLAAILALGIPGMENPGFSSTHKAPVMLVTGLLDKATPWSAAQEAYELLPSPRYLLGIVGAGHSGFTDLCGYIDDPRLSADGCSDEFTDPPTVRAVTNRLATPFFDRHLAGNTTATGGLTRESLEADLGEQIKMTLEPGPG